MRGLFSVKMFLKWQILKMRSSGAGSSIQYFERFCKIVIKVSQVSFMEEEIKNQKVKNGRKPHKKVKLDTEQVRCELKNQKVHDDADGSQSDDSKSSSGWSSEVIEPAIKSMNFRKKRGTRMKDLIKGKHKKDHFWSKYQDYFGGDLNRPEDSEDEEDYEASSSGRDEFDSDFDLTDSYVGKRGRKKGTKMKKRKRVPPKPQPEGEEAQPKPKGKRGRKRKVPIAETEPVQKSEVLLKEEKPQNLEKCEQPNNELKNSPLKNQQEVPVPVRSALEVQEAVIHQEVKVEKLVQPQIREPEVKAEGNGAGEVGAIEVNGQPL